jgi:hypothetical protein
VEYPSVIRTQAGRYSAMDLLSSCNLLNYWGKVPRKLSSLLSSLFYLLSALCSLLSPPPCSPASFSSSLLSSFLVLLLPFFPLLSSLLSRLVSFPLQVLVIFSTPLFTTRICARLRSFPLLSFAFHSSHLISSLLSFFCVSSYSVTGNIAYRWKKWTRSKITPSSCKKVPS